MTDVPGGATPTSRWLMGPRSRPNVLLRLYCFPHAGGNATAYQSWQASLPETVLVCPVHLPGRGPRLRERPIADLRELVQQLSHGLLPYLAQPFAFFGHSMGALIGFELAVLLETRYGLSPEVLIAAGMQPPHLYRPPRATYNLPDEQFIAELRSLEATPDELLTDPGLMRLLLPTIRADFRAVQTYRYRPSAVLKCAIAALAGSHEPGLTEEELRLWQVHSSSRLRTAILPGGHFFPVTARRQLLSELNQICSDIVRRLKAKRLSADCAPAK